MRVEIKRSHFLPFLVIDAVLTVALVGGGLRAFSAAHPAEAKNPYTLLAAQENYLKHSGAKVLNIAGLESHEPLTTEMGVHYWLGPKDGYSYTTQCTTPGQMTVTYLKPGDQLSDISIPRLSVTVFQNSIYFEQNPHPILANVEQTQVNGRGDVLNFDNASGKSLKITLAGSDEIVLIHYPTAQSAKAMLRDSELLTKIPNHQIDE
jgi:hypothetical protein